MWKRLKDKIKSVLATNSKIQEIYDYEVAEFGGDPCVTITPATDSADYRTTSENMRVYAFNVVLWCKRGGARTDHQAEEVLTDLIDSITRTFDKYFTLGTGSPGNALVLETGYTMIMVEAVPGEWFYAGREMEYRAATLTIKCHVNVDVTIIAGS